jgi:hypothetical protein
VIQEISDDAILWVADRLKPSWFLGKVIKLGFWVGDDATGRNMKFWVNQ